MAKRKATSRHPDEAEDKKLIKEMLGKRAGKKGRRMKGGKRAAKRARK